MALKITESLEVKLSHRTEILTEIFVGCTISNNSDIGPGVHILHIKTPVGKRLKTIAYLEFDTDMDHPRDEFHILYPKLQPMVAVAVDRFNETDVLKLERWMPEILAIAHYPIDRRYDGTTDKLAQADYGGRIEACVQILKSIEDEGVERNG
jgi:hypothetical protein